MPSPWPLLDSSLQHDLGLLRLRRDRARNPRTGTAHEFVVLESRDWVNVIPVTADGDIVMVRQYRHGVRQVTLEIPGGVLDHPHEDPLDAAARELREETGYTARRLVHLGTVHAQPAIQDNLCHTYLALDAQRCGEPTPDAGEDLRVTRFPTRELPHRVRRGEITHALVLTALYWFEQWRNFQL